MNLAEFPITLLADRAPKGQRTLIFRDGEQMLTVTGSDAYGLPTAADADVIVALIQLTKQANNFTDSTVPFSRYGLIRLLGWPNKGSSYERLTRSLKCWTGVTLNYQQAWWDNKAKRKVDATFHIIESVIINESSPTDDRSVSSFTWNRRFFDSCRADNLKRLDLETYFALESSISKRIYRFLDKRFYGRSTWTFDLHEFAYEHIGLTRNYTDNGKLKEKLAPGIAELERIGFLQPMAAVERYKKIKPGQWSVTFTLREADPALQTPQPVPITDGLEAELVARGVTASKAKSIVESVPAERIRRQIEHVDFIRDKHPSEIRSLGGFLRKAIEEDYAAPPGFVSKAELERRAAMERRKAQLADGERRRQAEAEAVETAAQARVDEYLDGLSMEGLESLDREILADPQQRTDYDRQYPKLKRLYLELLRKAHVRKKLGLPDQP